MQTKYKVAYNPRVMRFSPTSRCRDHTTVSWFRDSGPLQSKRRRTTAKGGPFELWGRESGLDCGEVFDMGSNIVGVGDERMGRRGKERTRGLTRW